LEKLIGAETLIITQTASTQTENLTNTQYDHMNKVLSTSLINISWGVDKEKFTSQKSSNQIKGKPKTSKYCYENQLNNTKEIKHDSECAKSVVKTAKFFILGEFFTEKVPVVD
jgi:hypothetical protein